MKVNLTPLTPLDRWNFLLSEGLENHTDNSYSDEYNDDDYNDTDKYEATEPDEPDPEMDIIVTSSGSLGSKTTVSYPGKRVNNLIEYDDDVEAYMAIADWMLDNHCFCNVWSISDHGNSEIVDISKYLIEAERERRM